jgi:cysteine desulfurase
MENIPGVAAMAAALRDSLEDSGDEAARQWKLTDLLRRGLEAVPGVEVHGHRTQRVPHIVCFSVADLDAEILSMALDDAGFRIAAGSNCSGAPAEPSPVLQQMGVPGRVSFRIGTGRRTSEADVGRFLEVLPSLTDRLRRVESASDAAMARYLPER